MTMTTTTMVTTAAIATPVGSNSTDHRSNMSISPSGDFAGNGDSPGGSSNSGSSQRSRSSNSTSTSSAATTTSGSVRSDSFEQEASQSENEPVGATERYFCWDCKDNVDAGILGDGEFHCRVCGCTSVEVSDVPADDPNSPEKFGETVTSAHTTPANSPHLGPVANDDAQRTAPPSSSGRLLVGGGPASGGSNDLSNSLESTIQNLFQMLFSSRAALGDESGGYGDEDNFGTLGDYAFGDIQDIIENLSLNNPSAPRVGPASEKLIASLPRYRITPDSHEHDDAAPCAICTENLRQEGEREAVAVQLGCKHMFHDLCATMWLKQSGTCPVCRFDVRTMGSPPKQIPSAHPQDGAAEVDSR